MNITSPSSPLVQTNFVPDNWGTKPRNSNNELSLRTFLVMNETGGLGGMGGFVSIFSWMSFSSSSFSFGMSSWESLCFHQALDLMFELDEAAVGFTRDILRQRDCLDRLSETPWVVPTFIVIEGEVLVELPPNGRTIRSKWLFKKKTDMDGKVHTFKAHLVAKGYTQTYDVDYGETFSPVAYIRAIRILLAIAAFYDYEIWQMDVKTTFLNGEAAYILGIKIIRDRSKRLIALSQSAYLEKTQKKFRLENSKKRHTPMIKILDYRKSQGAQTPSEVQRIRRVPYASVIGSIICFQKNPSKIHKTTVKTILKYLRNTKDMVLVYEAKPKSELKVSSYADSAEQRTTVMYSTEAEYIVVVEASMEVVWMRKFIDGLGDVVPSNKRHVEMLYDNKPAIAITNDPKILKGARNFQRKYHYIREVIQERKIVLKKVHIDDNVAVLFTKPMPFNKHYEHAMAIGIIPASSLM
ncbi:retrotransposon protein, putative, ty1-copia subclass [Tanacetum coccineum]